MYIVLNCILNNNVIFKYYFLVFISMEFLTKNSSNFHFFSKLNIFIIVLQRYFVMSLRPPFSAFSFQNFIFDTDMNKLAINSYSIKNILVTFTFSLLHNRNPSECFNFLNQIQHNYLICSCVILPSNVLAF